MPGPALWQPVVHGGRAPRYRAHDRAQRVQDLVERAALPRVVGIGETGLDYYGMEDRKGGRTVADMEWQRERFRTPHPCRPAMPQAFGHPHPRGARRHHPAS